MGTMRCIVGMAFGALLLAFSAADASAQGRGEQLYVLCATCHGEDGAGNPVLRAPQIAGLDRDYLIRQLESFRAGDRGDPASPYANQMRLIALTLDSDDDVTAVAEHVSGLSPPEAPAVPEGDAQRGRQVYTLCAACHGQRGEGRTPLQSPRLAGQSAAYLVDSLQAFRSGIRGGHPQDVYGTQMRIMAQTLRDDHAVYDVVAYISTLDAPAPSPSFTGDLMQGRETFRLCAACHGEAAEGNDVLHAPRLAGQFDWYLVAQLEAYRSGLRGGDTPGDDIESQMEAQMRSIALTLPDEDAIRNVAAYISAMGLD